MAQAPAATLRHAAGLCAVAGFVDAYGYVELGHVFTANMTGNTVLMSVALARGELGQLLPYAVTLASFLAGALAGSLLKGARHAVVVSLLLGAVLLVVLGATRPPAGLALAALSFAMGLQGAALSMFDGVRMQTVVVTATLVNLVDGLVQRWRMRLDPTAGAAAPAAGSTRLLVASWAAYGMGAAVAALLLARASLILLVPAALLLAIATDLLLRRRVA